MPPWELAEQPSFWRDRALFAEGAEAEAQRRAAIEARRTKRIEEFQHRSQHRSPTRRK